MNHEISLDDAIDLTKRFRTLRPTVLNPEYANTDILPTCETFDLETVNALLQNDQCRGLRIYYGMSDDLKVHAVLVGVGENNEDLLPGSTEQYLILENADRCPTICPPASALNS
ncbi:MAG: hypothetical protein EOO11_08025 [Chitinophagaceae bacterium]|nr:MAG: hypothetical protein EOO11_08025 [Chitinophagaceae bacterium]